MRSNVRLELESIADYVQKETEFDIRTPYKIKRDEFMMSLYLFYVLSKENTIASNGEIGEVANRHASTVSLALKRNSHRAKIYHHKAYTKFNPFKNKIESLGNPFSETRDILYKAKRQLEEDSAFVDRQSAKLLLRQVKNEKMFDILKMLKVLDHRQLDVILERLPPIIRMAQEFN